MEYETHKVPRKQDPREETVRVNLRMISLSLQMTMEGPEEVVG